MWRATWMIVLWTGIVSAPPHAAAEPYNLQAGHRHTDFTLPNISDGKPNSLSQFRGQKVLLIHFASW